MIHFRFFYLVCLILLRVKNRALKTFWLESRLLKVESIRFESRALERFRVNNRIESISVVEPRVVDPACRLRCSHTFVVSSKNNYLGDCFLLWGFLFIFLGPAQTSKTNLGEFQEFSARFQLRQSQQHGNPMAKKLNHKFSKKNHIFLWLRVI